MTTFERLTDSERDMKLAIVSTLVNLQHGDLLVSWPEHEAASKRDPELYAHFVSWYFKNGRVRDHKALATAALLLGDADYRRVGRGAMMELAPFEAVNVDAFVRGKLKRETRAYRRAFADYVYRLFDDQGRALGLIARSKKTADYMIRRVHPRLNPIVAAAMGFGDAKLAVDTAPWAISQLATATPELQAALIRKYRIPFTSAVGALGEGGIKPDVLRAIVEQMSPQEVINMAQRLEAYGAMNDAQLAETIRKKIEQAGTRNDVNLAKISVANAGVKSSALTDMLTNAQEAGIKRAVDKAVGKKVNDRKVNVAFGGDKSGSMRESIPLMAQVMANAYKALPNAQFYAYMYDSFAKEIALPKDMTYDSIIKALNKYAGGGSTSPGAVVKALADNKRHVDTVIFSTDGEDNSSPSALVALKHYSDAMGYMPEVLILNVKPGHDKSLENNARKAGASVTNIDWKGDYNGLNNLLVALAPGGRWGLLEAVYNTPLLG